MALIFDYEKDLDTGAQPFISHEKNSVLYNYYISNELAMDKNTSINGGLYDDVLFKDEARHLTTKAVSRIGVKNFPGIGGIGFYKDAYSDDSRAVAPIHPDHKEYEAPTLITARIEDDKLHLVVSPPSNLTYTCYRVVVRQEAFAFEYVIYKTDYFVDVPTVKGQYTVYCIGYDEDNGTVSENSNELILNVLNGDPDWQPYLTAVDDLNHRMDTTEAAITAVEEQVAGLDTRVTKLEEGGGGGGGSSDSLNVTYINGINVVQADEAIYEEVLSSEIIKEE